MNSKISADIKQQSRLLKNQLNSQKSIVVATPKTKLPETIFEDIGPEEARIFLESNPGNRKIRAAFVERYAVDMKEGRWRLSHQGIAFDTEGNLLDGQHRLLAIIRSGCVIRMAVTYNLDKACNEILDAGAGRSVKDALRFQGKEIQNLEAAVAQRMLMPLESYYAGRFGFTRGQILESFLKHEDAIRSVMKMFPTTRRRVTLAGVLTPITRAWYSEEESRLNAFAKLIYHGFTDEEPHEEDKTALLLKDWLIRTKSVIGYQGEREVYAKVERALRGYLDGERLNTLYGAKTELFPLPGDEL
jgi:hypothetical protein